MTDNMCMRVIRSVVIREKLASKGPRIRSNSKLPLPWQSKFRFYSPDFTVTTKPPVFPRSLTLSTTWRRQARKRRHNVHIITKSKIIFEILDQRPVGKNGTFTVQVCFVCRKSFSMKYFANNCCWRSLCALYRFGKELLIGFTVRAFRKLLLIYVYWAKVLTDHPKYWDNYFVVQYFG